jgi:hypothetical protein
VSGAAIFVTALFVLGGLGFVLGRRVWIVLVFAAPIVFWWIWAAANQGGPDDDVTGPASAFLGAVCVGAVLLGFGARWLVFGIAWLLTRAPAVARPRRF